MGDHFVLLVDRLLTESTLGAAIESRNLLKQTAPVTIDETIIDCSSHKNSEASLSPRKLVECRICQDEDVDSNMEAPCSCSGSLKVDCLMHIENAYKGGAMRRVTPHVKYAIRGNWQIARRDLNNPHIIAMVSTDHSFLDPDYDDYDVSTSRSIFMVLLILRHTLPVIVSRGGNYSFPLIMLLMLRIAGISLPICIILKAVTSIIRRRQQQANLSMSESDEEVSPLTLHQPHVIAVQ
ncbi:hypothetical protein DH2020_043885 [Rehmannia glutinosa]|uniref:RING-CH-type domain-containing protein n=1 Tax=Rehmannia glutinosa TaxID=99300 RepID=A0ABR0UIF4_REHGL